MPAHPKQLEPGRDVSTGDAGWCRHEVPLLPARRSDLHKSASFDESPPTERQIKDLIADQIQGVFFTGAGLAGLPRDGLSWLENLPSLRVLQISAARQPHIPEAVLHRLEHLEWVGRSSQRIDTSQLPALRGLTVGPWEKITGNLRVCPALLDLAVAGYPLPDLRILEGCGALRLAKIQCRHQSLALGWHEAPKALKELIIINETVDAFDGIEKLEKLEILSFDRGRRPLPEATLDVRPLAACAHLRYVTIDRLGTLTHLDHLAQLPRLEAVLVPTDRYTPLDAPGVPLVT